LGIINTRLGIGILFEKIQVTQFIVKQTQLNATARVKRDLVAMLLYRKKYFMATKRSDGDKR